MRPCVGLADDEPPVYTLNQRFFQAAIASESGSRVALCVLQSMLRPCFAEDTQGVESKTTDHVWSGVGRDGSGLGTHGPSLYSGMYGLPNATVYRS